ncbi:Transcription antiterminator LicT [compost metagenome]
MDHNEINLTIKTSKMIKDIMDIISYHFKVEIDESSWNYNRFVTHLKFFAQRLFANETSEQGYNALFQDLRSKFPHEYKCVQKIDHYIDKQYGQPLTNDEMMYLIIHISRLVNRTEQ